MCDELGNMPIPQNPQERRETLDSYMRKCKDDLGKVEFDQIIKEDYGDIIFIFLRN